MKNLRLSLLAVIAIVGTFAMNACTGTEDDIVLGPTLNFLGDAGYVAQDMTIAGGSEFKVGIIGSHDSKIDKLEVRVQYDGGAELVPASCTICDSTIGSKDLSVDFINTVRDQPGTEVWSFTLIDKDGNATKKSIEFTTTAAPKPVRAIDVTLGNQASASLGSSYSLSEFNLYLVADAKAASDKIDIIYVKDDGGTEGNILCAPSSSAASTFLSGASGPASWSTKNATKLRRTDITSAEFDAMTDSKMMLEALADNSGASDKIAELVVGDVILVEPVSAGKNALIKIVSIDSDNSMTVKVSVEDI